MTDQNPRYRSLSVNFLGFLAKQLGDLRGPSSLAYELIQNADDAKDDSLQLSATRIVFDIRDDALVVSNDAVFRKEDFERISDIASGTKKQEEGDRTTGAFGVGFISVYQVTDRPEIRSANQRWIFRPEKQEGKRIKMTDDTLADGTEFRFPWACEESELRAKLQAPPVTEQYIKQFAEELEVSLPKAILFLKKLESIELIHQEGAIRLRRAKEKDGLAVYYNGERQFWRIFSDWISPIKGIPKDNRSALVRVAIPDKFIDEGILFATLPTEESGLPFHIDADFFPNSDRKSIMFKIKYNDPKSRWNQDALQVAASIVRDNLIVIRDMFINNPIDFWTMLESLYNIKQGIKPDARIPLGLFWEKIEPIMEINPIVYTESNRWLKPAEVRIPASNEEWNAIVSFESLDIEIVHQGLRKFRNLLTGNGVKLLGIEDIYKAFEEKGLIANPQSISLFYQNYERLELMWQGIFAVYDRIQSKTPREKAKAMLSECVLAPGMDGRIWPCDSVYLVEDDFTYKIFSHLLPGNRSFLDRRISMSDNENEEEPGSFLLRVLCPIFSPVEAIESLEGLERDELKGGIDQKGFRSEDIIRWFSKRQSDMNELLYERLVHLPIFPTSEGSITSLEDLWMPGDFSDPIGFTEILDMERLRGLSGFLQVLGVKELTFNDYAKRYITEAFGSDSSIELETKFRLLKMLEEHIDQIKEDEQLRLKIAGASIVECKDGSFRTPKEVYFPNSEVVKVLGDYVSYCALPARLGKDRRELYQWLGVADHPRTKDIIRVVDRLIDKSPDQRTRKSIINCLKVVAKNWEYFSDNEKRELKLKKWLPAIGSSDRWHKPGELYTYEHKVLFETQASFLDAPDKVQQKLRSVLKYLGLKSVPQPWQVVEHLLKCSQDDVKPPGRIYNWLTRCLEDILDRDLCRLQDSACLYMDGKYLRPDQVFWRNHFGRFRFQLEQEMRSYSELLQAVGVKEKPDHDDAIKLLKEIPEILRNDKLENEDKDAVLRCWLILSKALDQEEIDDATIREELHNIPCIPNDQDVLVRPAWLFYEDRPRLKDRFRLLRNNCIQRTEGTYRGMEAAGVRLLSSAISARVIKEGIHLREERIIKHNIMKLRPLIITILEGLSNYNSHNRQSSQSINDIQFLSTDELGVNWKLEAFNQVECSKSTELSHFDRDEKVVYFKDAKNPPWSAIARELAYALAHGGNVASISPGLKVVLEADNYEDACQQLEDLGIALTEELARPPKPSEGVAFDDADVVPSETEEPTETEEVTDDDVGINSAYFSIPAEPDEAKGDQDIPSVPYVKRFHEYQKTSPQRTSRGPVRLPQAGPQTNQSASKHIRESAKKGRTGMNIKRWNTMWEPTEAASDLARKFREMMLGDYWNRCQICGTTFSTSAGRLQVYVVHLLPPSEDHRTNYYGNLLGVCGWHYSLIRYNRDREFFDPITERAFERAEHMRDYVIATDKPDIDEMDNLYFGLGIRFRNIYRQWSSEPTTEGVVIRYCEPHWAYLRELLLS